MNINHILVKQLRFSNNKYYFKIYDQMKSNVPYPVLFGLPAPDALVFWKDPESQIR